VLGTSEILGTMYVGTLVLVGVCRSTSDVAWMEFGRLLFCLIDVYVGVLVGVVVGVLVISGLVFCWSLVGVLVGAGLALLSVGVLVDICWVLVGLVFWLVYRLCVSILVGS
jgi:hypothetical protein